MVCLLIFCIENIIRDGYVKFNSECEVFDEKIVHYRYLWSRGKEDMEFRFYIICRASEAQVKEAVLFPESRNLFRQISTHYLSRT